MTHKFTVKHSKYPNFTVVIPIQWNIDPYKRKNWKHHFMSFRWINIDIQPSLLKQLLEDFIKYHIIEKKPNQYYNTIAADHSTCIRISWLLQYRTKISQNDSDNVLYSIDKIIQHDIANLSRDDNYRFGHNHGLMADIALVKCYIGVEKFKKKIDIKRIIQRSLKTLYSMFSQDSGVTNEHSVAYQSYNFTIFRDLFCLVAKHEELHFLIDMESLSDFYDKVKRSSKELLTVSLRDNNTFFPIGDSPIIPNINHLSVIFDCNASEVFHNIHASSNKRVLYLFKEGFCFFRKGNAKLESNIDLVFLCGWNSHNHKQNDELSFMLDYKNINFFDDGGYNEYISWDDLLKLQDEDHHSTITIKDEQWSKKDKPDGRTLIDGYFKDGIYYIHGEHFRINGIRIARNISIKGDSLLISDYVDPLINKISRHRFVLGTDVRVLRIDPPPPTHPQETQRSRLVLTKGDYIMEMYCSAEWHEISTETINVATGRDSELKSRVTLDFFVKSSTEERVDFLLTFDKTDMQLFNLNSQRNITNI